VQSLGKGAKKAVVDEAWRQKLVEGRIEYSLVKVGGSKALSLSVCVCVGVCVVFA